MTIFLAYGIFYSSLSNFTENNILAKGKFYFVQGNVIIKECVFSRTTASNIITVGQTNMFLYSSSFHENTVNTMLAGIENTLVIEQCTFRNNTAFLNLIENIGGNITFQSLIFFENICPNMIVLANTTAKLLQFNISKSNSDAVFGIQNSFVQVFSSKFFQSNHIFILKNSHLNVRNSTFSQSQRLLELSEQSTAALTNCTISNNSIPASFSCIGLIVVNPGCQLTLHSCTFNDNDNAQFGDKCALFFISSSVMTTINTVFINNNLVVLESINSSIVITESKLLSTDFDTCFQFTKDRVFMRDCTFILNRPNTIATGVVYATDSSIAVQNSTFYWNGKIEDDLQMHDYIFALYGGNIAFDHCMATASVKQNLLLDKHLGTAVGVKGNTSVRTSFSTFNNIGFDFDSRKGAQQSRKYLTWNTTFSSPNGKISSEVNKDHFLQEAVRNGFIENEKRLEISQQEIKFASSTYKKGFLSKNVSSIS